MIVMFRIHLAHFRGSINVSIYFELRPSCLLHRLVYYLKYTLSPFFALSYFSDKFSLLLTSSLDINHPTYTFLLAGIIDVKYHTWFIC
jgi:hypothetical protein